MTKKRVLIVDPPSGWQFGFPKPIEEEYLGPYFANWLRSQGYPEKLIPSALKHSRWWTTESEADIMDDVEYPYTHHHKR